MIDLNSYFSNSGSDDDRRIKYKDQYKPEYLDNANKLLKQVNALLNELGIKDVKVSSGWRPATINASLPNSAKKSLHMVCLAVDIHDNDKQDLANLIKSRPDLLKKYNIWLENPNATQGWTHLDIGTRSDRPLRMFNP